MRGGTRGRRTVLATAAVGLLGVLGAACAAAPPAPLPQRDPARPCTASAMRSCLLPYPSDEWTVPDPSTATGRRVDLPEELVPAAARAALGPGAGVTDAEAGADGFSAIGPVMFELDRAVEPGSLPADGGDVVRVFDVATGKPAAVRVELALDAVRQGGQNTIVAAWPAVRWEPGHTYVARVTDGLRAAQGTLARAPGLDSSSTASVRAELARIEGDRWAHVLEATRFTVRSSQSATHRFDALTAVARNEDHPVRNITVDPLPLDGMAAVVRGEVSLSDFRDADGVIRDGAAATPTWEKFQMILPSRPAGTDGAPVAVYGHGLIAAKETMLFVAASNARAGIATIGVDVPNHGDRQDEGGFLLDITRPSTLGRLVSMPLQGEVDTVSLVSAIRHHLDDLDLIGRSGQIGADGVADLDTTRLLYEGTSMGGVLGAASITALPELSGAYLQVPGSGIADILYHSLLWPLFMSVVPDGMSAGDAAALEGVVTLLLDPADNTNLVDRLRGSDMPLFLQYGVGDGVVPNWTTERLMALTGVPLVEPEIWPLGLDLPRTGSSAMPADGRGAAQVYNMDSAPDTLGFLAHVSFAQPQADELLRSWLDDRLAAMGLGHAGS